MSKAIRKDILMCPICKRNELLSYDNNITCSNCDTKFATDNGKLYFSDSKDSDVLDVIDKIKFRLKKYDKFYNLLINIISPVCISKFSLRRFIKRYVAGKDVVALNLGSGNNDLDENIVNVDLFRYENVDMTADMLNLPIICSSVDVIINTAVLEHVPYPEKAVAEFYRVLKPNGVVYCFFPFIQGYHASPYDYSRRSIEGLKTLFKDFEVLEIKDAVGPTSGFLWIFQEYFAILFSFGCKPLYHFLLFLIMLLTFPIKFIDFILIKHPMGKNISSGFVIEAKKRGEKS